jgi:hypothetical protein
VGRGRWSDRRQDIENDARRRTVVSSSDDHTVADDEEEFALVVVVEHGEGVDGLAEGVLVFGVTGDLT